MRRLSTMLAVALVLGACSSTPKQSTTAATTTIAPTTTVPSTPEDAFMAAIQSSGFGDVDMTEPSNREPLINIGKHKVCEVFDDGADYGMVAQALIDTEKHPTGEQVKVYIRAAVENFCPRNVAKLPNS